MHCPLKPWILPLCVVLPWSALHAETAPRLQQHNEALQMHRAGDPAAAAELLMELHRQYPAEQRILYDLIAALSSAGQDKETLGLADKVGEDAPAYVYEALGRSARNLRDYPLAVDFYRKAVRQSPGRAVPVAGEMMSLADGLRPADALQRFEALPPDMKAHPLVQEARAYALWRSDNFFAALQAYQTILVDHPDASEALRGRILMLARLQLPWFARAFAERNPDLLDSADRAWMESIRPARMADPRWDETRNDLMLFHDEVMRPSGCDCEKARIVADRVLETPAANDVKRLIERLPADVGQHPALQSVWLASAGRLNDQVARLTASQTVIRQRPDDSAAQAERVRALASLGAARQALALATARHPALLPPTEMEQLRLDAARETMLWRRADDDRLASERYRSTDEALAMLDILEVEMSDPRPAQELKVRALRDRVRMREAVALYHQLEFSGTAMSPETRAAAADALLYLREPEQARDLYLSVLEEKPDFHDARLGLYYAYLESEDFDQAQATLDEALAREPEYLFPEYVSLRRYNDRHRELQRARAMFLAYDNRPAEALKAQQPLLMAAPMDPWLRANRATVYGFRGWPRRSLEEFDWLLAAEPQVRDARIGRTEQLMVLGHYETSWAETQALMADHPENLAVQRLERQWTFFHRPELIIDASWGNSSNPTVSGQQDYIVETWLYSPPLNYRTRLFAHGYETEGEYEEGDISYGRWGAGVEYRWYDLTLTAEAHRGRVDEDRTGVTLGAAWEISDHWSLSLQHDSNSLKAPLRGRPLGLTARSTTLDASWRAHEGRRIDLSAGYHDFSDGNTRTNLLGAWTEELYARSAYRLDARLELYTSKNTETDRIYFNPSRDASASISMINDWKTWRRYERAFHQRLTLTLGDYWQEDYGSGLVAGATYEHDWSIDPRLSLVYGISFLHHPYDGEHDNRTALHLRLDTRF